MLSLEEKKYCWMEHQLNFEFRREQIDFSSRSLDDNSTDSFFPSTSAYLCIALVNYNKYTNYYKTLINKPSRHVKDFAGEFMCILHCVYFAR
jgi:hypothetical protein